MEHGGTTRNPGVFQKIRLFVQSVHRRSQTRKPSPETLSISRGLALLTVAIILAWISVETTENQATENYRLSHWPKEKIWVQTLVDQGLSPQNQLGKFTSLLKTHPDAYSDSKRIWVSTDACAVYLSNSPYRQGPELWTCDPTLQTTNWKSLGSGLAGFEKLSDLFETTPRRSKKAPPTRGYKIDPKEFRY